MKLDISPKEFRATIMSHGYFWLRPMIGTEDPPSVLIPFNLPEAKGCIMMSTYEKEVDLEAITGTEGDAVGIATLCLSLDADLTELRKIARKDKKWKWILSEKKGRFLKSPSLFEDCLKAILTINTNWKRTVQMAETLVEQFGESTGVEYRSIDVKSCPTPEALVKLDEGTLKSKANMGFRAKYILNLAEEALEKPDIYLGAGWRRLSNDEFCDEIGSISGMGQMSVAYISRLYGKTNSYHMDSYVLRRCAELWNLNEDQVEAYVKKRYKAFGNYGPAVFWFELTRHWHYSDEEAFELDL